MSQSGTIQAGTWIFAWNRGAGDLMSINVMRSQRKTRLLVTSNGFVFSALRVR
jgi:tetrahydromethanopterin S-methyltransferase subunit D